MIKKREAKLLVDLLRQEMNKKDRWIFGGMVLFLFVVTILMAVIGQNTKTLDGYKWMNNFGGITPIIEMLATVIVATRFAGVDSNERVRINMENHNKFTIFVSKVITCTVSYLILLAVAVVTIIMMKYLIFPARPLAGRLALELQWATLGNMAYVLIFSTFVMMVIGFCKTWYSAIAFGIACNYITEAIAGVFMIFIYVHRELIYNPFNFFFVEKQIQDGMKHMMTRLSLNQIIVGSIMYAMVFFVISAIIFMFIRKFPTNEELMAKKTPRHANIKQNA
jgi:hypothetical protein